MPMLGSGSVPDNSEPIRKARETDVIAEAWDCTDVANRGLIMTTILPFKKALSEEKPPERLQKTRKVLYPIETRVCDNEFGSKLSGAFQFLRTWSILLGRGDGNPKSQMIRTIIPLASRRAMPPGFRPGPASSLNLRFGIFNPP